PPPCSGVWIWAVGVLALLQGPILVVVISFSRGAVFCVLGGAVQRVWSFLGGGGRLRVASGAVDGCAAGSLVVVGSVVASVVLVR
ncbi:hypothetical protein A2U01_0064039, partial [Trifolium medium]|nr:hypothetical protein [Trifolium medium]